MKAFTCAPRREKASSGSQSGRENMRCSRKCAVPSGTVWRSPFHVKHTSSEPKLVPRNANFSAKPGFGSTRTARPFGSVRK